MFSVQGGSHLCLKNLSKMKSLEAYAPEAMKAFVAFDKATWPTAQFRQSIRN
jgi:hypothetical protein